MAFTWLGMVPAISFLEAPLKFRAPDVTPALGLGIGRVVFAALNRVEMLFALALVVCLVAGPRTTTAIVLGAAVVLVLLVQLVAVRPALTRRSDRVLAGETGKRSHAHFAYIGLEVLKVAALLAFGVVSL
ncbi:hypothetical protein [Amycolatopsis sp. cmx-4-61]|uniref:hypothetical protein n=1 Tax=Amycolatopsis sp. cmx-4-61 TaxID=2790937 RepID=UPI00397D4877